MFDKVKETILVYNMLSKGDSVLIALSGGSDSVALLYILKRLMAHYRLRLFIGHLNHGLRGKEATRDEKFCRDLGKRLDVPVFTARINIKNLRRKEARGSIEDLARKERYKFLEKVAQRVGATKVALGHTADDQVETVIMRLLRGAGTKGLSGIPPRRKLEGTDAWIVRPLIGVWRDEILKYLEKGKISYVEDSTNRELNFLRNRIRHELLPLLSRYNPNIKEILEVTGRNMVVVNDYLEGIIEEEFRKMTVLTTAGVEVKRARFTSYHPAISQMLIRRIVKEVDPQVHLEADNVQKVLALAGNASGSKDINLPKRIWVRREYDRLIFCKVKERGDRRRRDNKELVINGKTKVMNPKVLIVSKLCKQNGSRFPLFRSHSSSLSSIFQKKGLSFEVELDYDSLSRPIVVRTREPGDVFHPIGMKGTKKVKDIFIDEKVPRIYRNKIPILVSGNQICWVVGYRIGERFKVRPNTKRILRIKVEVHPHTKDFGAGI